MCTRCCPAEHAKDGASNSTQYIFLDDTLVAPIWDTVNNISSRTVWIPPGSWQDAWDGSRVEGPKTMTVAQPFERIPMWHRAEGGLIVMASSVTANVQDQDWSTLTLEAFPSRSAGATHRSVYERSSDPALDEAQELEYEAERAFFGMDFRGTKRKVAPAIAAPVAHEPVPETPPPTHAAYEQAALCLAP